MYNSNMKKVLGLIITPLLVLMSRPVFATSTENFYFDDFTADYYLSRDAEGISHLKVVENLTAVFPDYNQNKGICREIPFTNYGGVNVTLEKLDASDIELLRNGESEPIYSIEKKNDYYRVCTGTEEYVLGKQVYTFEYEFTKVVTDFQDYQELYWDTNGNGWWQKFNKVTARVHFDKEILPAYTGESWCYVGSYGASGKERCKIKQTDDGVEFKAEDLARYENLTFDMEIKPGTFVVPAPKKNYALVILTVLTLIIAILCLIPTFKRFAKSRTPKHYYEDLFEKPEYQPHKKYDIAEMTELYFGKKKDVRVGMILDLIVRRKISIVREEGVLKEKWSIKVNSLDAISEEEKYLLEILNGGDLPEVGEEFKLKNRTANTTLVGIEKKFSKGILANLKKDQLVTKDYTLGINRGGGAGNLIVSLIVYAPMLVMIGAMIYGFLEDMLGLGGNFHGILVFEDGFLPTEVLIIVLALILGITMNGSAKKYLYYQNAGLDAAKYMDGLKLYIEMAEADRLKFLQSVEGADVSTGGIVKLYEKLLPYAAVFGLEESWMKELKDYCKLEEVEEPDWLMTGITAAQISRFGRSAASVARSSSTMSSSGGIAGGGGSSSGFSGGGGGGFSGGGGGGGGGGGR